MSALIGDIIGQYAGPVLVVGGGSSVLEDLPRLKATNIEPAAVISANDHGFQQDFFRPTHIVCCDHTHGITGEPLEKRFRPHGVPVISLMAWADYRLPDWKININSGLTAIAVALALGGCPVIVTGLDCYNLRGPAPTYFHDATAKSNSTRKLPVNFKKQIDALLALAKGAPVRPLSGPLLDHFPVYDPGERVLPVALPFVERLASTPTVRVHITARRPFPFRMARVAAGMRFAVSPDEARSLVANQRAKII